MTEGIVLAAATAAIYFVAFEYERGYAEYFGIPYRLINVGLPVLLRVGGATAGGAYIAYLAAALVVPALIRRGSMVCARTVWFSVRAVPLALLLYAFWDEWSVWLLVCGWLTSLIYLEFIRPLWSQREARTYNEKLQKDHDTEGDWLVLLKWLPRGWVVAFWLLFALWLTSYYAGLFGLVHARKQRDFYLIPGEPERVVLAIYGDLLVTAPLYRVKEVGKPNLARKDLLILRVGQQPSVNLRLEAVGPLSLSALSEAQREDLEQSGREVEKAFEEAKKVFRDHARDAAAALANDPTLTASMDRLRKYREEHGPEFYLVFARNLKTGQVAEQLLRFDLTTVLLRLHALSVWAGTDVDAHRELIRSIRPQTLRTIQDVVRPLDAAVNPKHDAKLFGLFQGLQ